MKNALKFPLVALSSLGLLACAANADDSSSTLNVSNPNYVAYPETSLIQRDLSGLDRVYRRNYTKFINYPTPNGSRVLLVATDGMSDEQLLRAYNILDFYLTDVPGSKYGANKAAVANAMAANDAVLVLPGGADGESPIRDSALAGQPLYALEFPVEGSAAYINNDYEQRDAGLEEIFHLVHDTGIGTKFTPGALKETYQAEIASAMENSLANGLWGNGAKDWLDELRPEGSLSQEYIASVLDSYYGLWGAWTEAPGGMWGIYTSKTRAEIEVKDPLGAALVPQFLSENITYMARIDPSFQGTFQMSFDTSAAYTHKSQYLVNARLLGDNASNLSGNANDNIFMGNSAANSIDGKAGTDVVQYAGASGDYAISTVGGTTTVSSQSQSGDVDTLTNIEVLRFTDKDVQL